MSGWIKLHRKITEHWIWEDPEKLKWWLDLIMMANHEPRNILINNEIVKIDIGERHTSEKKLSNRWNCSRKKVSNFLKLLEKDEMITFTKSRQQGTSYKVLNYGDYQAKKQVKEHRGNIGNRGTKGEQTNNSQNDVSNSFQDETEKGEKGTSSKERDTNGNNDKIEVEEHQRNIERTSKAHREHIAGTSREHRGNINKNYKELEELKELKEVVTGDKSGGDNPPSKNAFTNFEELWLFPNLTQREILQEFVSLYGDDLVSAGIKIAGSKDVKKAQAIPFVEAVLQEWTDNNVKTLEQAREYQRSRNTQKRNNSYGYNNKSANENKLPGWAKDDAKPIEEESISDEDQQAYAERLERLRKMREGAKS